jgi:hypothetical protein
MKGLKAMPTTIPLLSLSLLLINILQNETSSDFNGLGKQLLGGFAIAVAVAVAYALIKLRLRDQKPRAQFISITSPQEKEATAKPASD